MRIAHNQIIDYFRKSNRFSTISSQYDKDVFENMSNYECAERSIIKEQAHYDLRQLIKLLPYDQRRVIVMRHYGELDFKCIAENVNFTIVTLS
jgi:RNA polymerase sigma-70 factor (ECF subfamily)